MAKMTCRCGELLSNNEAPNDIELKVYTDKEWDDILNVDSIDPIMIPSPKYNVWRCPKCERLYFFENGKDAAVKIYNIEE